MSKNQLNTPQISEYWARINKAIDYIENNLEKDLSLAEIADVACFSKFHFHRIFYFLTGETLGRFITRLKIEKAAALLCNPNKSITEIALDCGFSDSAVFARTFKSFFNISASKWRSNKSFLKPQNSNLGKYESNLSKEYLSTYRYFNDVNLTNIRNRKMTSPKSIEVKELDEMTLVYVRYIGPYKGNSNLFERLFGELMSWAGPRGLINFPKTKSICVYHDNPEITDEDKLRVSVAITAPKETIVSGAIGKMVIAKGQYVVARFEINVTEFQDAWNRVCDWFTSSGYQPADGSTFEMYHNDCREHPENKYILDICMPVKPL